MYNHLQLRLHQSIEEIFATNHREKYLISKITFIPCADFENYQKNFKKKESKDGISTNWCI